MAEFDELALFARIEGFPERFDRGIRLMDAQVTLGQQSMSSTCAVELADPDGAIANKLITHSLLNGGIPLLKPPSAKVNAQVNPGSGGNGSQTADTSLNAQRRAFLDLLAWAEGTISFGSNNGYDVYFGGKIFKNYKDHPDLTGEIPYTGTSNASGRYQFMARSPATWEETKSALGLPDFSPTSQDKAAIYRVQYRGALQDVDQGKIEAALDKTSYEWASLPPYRYPGQGTKTMPECLAYYNERLKLYQGGNVSPSQKTDPKKDSKDPSVTVTATESTEVFKGNKLFVYWGDVAFEFFHQSTEYDFTEGKTTISGVGIRWVLNRRPRNKTYAKQTFRSIAEQVAKNQGMTLRYEATYDVYYEFVDQSGLSDYQLLKREAERAGLVLSEEGNTLVVKSIQNIKDTAIVLEYQNNVISLVVLDKALDSSAEDFGSPLGQSTGSKIDIDPTTGKMVQSKPDIDPTKSNDVTGQSAKQPTGKLAPGTEPAVDRAQQKWKRVKGLPTKVVIPLSEDSLGITPMMAVRTKGFGTFVDRIWVVDSVSHSYSEATTTLQLYSPVSVKDDVDPLSPNIASVAGQVAPSGWIFPVSGYPVTDIMGYSAWRGRNHDGTDVGTPTGVPVKAMNDGVCIGAAYKGGYGNFVQIQHGGGIETAYAHLDSMKVRTGQKVSRGEVIGISGNTGVGTGAHLHFEVLVGGQVKTPSAVGLPEPYVGMVLN